MISFIKRMWAAAPLATVLLAIALSASAFFGVRTVTSWIYWNDPRHIEQPIEGWMTPGYVGNSWQVPREVMFEALQLERGVGPRPLEHIAKMKSVPLETLVLQIEQAIADFRADTPLQGGS